MQDSPTPLVRRLCCGSSVSGICSRCCQILPHDELEAGVAAEGKCFKQKRLQSPVTNPTFASRMQYLWPAPDVVPRWRVFRRQRPTSQEEVLSMLTTWRHRRSEMNSTKTMYMISAGMTPALAQHQTARPATYDTNMRPAEGGVVGDCQQKLWI